MKKILTCFIFMLFYVSGVMAAPFLICDPQAGATEYRIVWEGGATEYINAEPDGSIKYNIGPLPAGTVNGTLEAGAEYTLDGSNQPAFKWSTPPLPFVLGVPSSVQSPTGIGISE